MELGAAGGGGALCTSGLAEEGKGINKIDHKYSESITLVCYFVMYLTSFLYILKMLFCQVLWPGSSKVILLPVPEIA